MSSTNSFRFLIIDRHETAGTKIGAMSFLQELKRRNVYRVAVLYIVVSWLILQVTDVIVSVLSLPEWTGKLVFTLLAIGFPVAMILAWAFELTPEGVKRDRATDEDDAAAPARPVRLDFLIGAALMVAVGYFAWQHDWSGGPDTVDPREIRSIAVLPLENLMNDPEQSYFVAGMHEALITELSKIDALRVISRTSAMRYQNAGKTVPEIGQELGVDAVVEGSVLKAGDTVRITVQLIATESDQHLWADNFDRQLSDILALYGEVTREIANQIRVTLTADDRADIATVKRVDPEVYELYLKGRYLCDNWSPEEMVRGTKLLEKALSLDPRNAPAHAQLALCLQYRAFFGYSDPEEIYPQAQSAAMEAVELDDQLAEAHVALAGVKYYLNFEPSGAMKSLDRALDLNPNSVRALLHASWLQGESGQFRMAFERIRKALDLDPLSTVVNDAVGQLYYLSRDYESAIAAYRKALDLDLSDPSLHFHLAWPYEQLGRFDEAIELHTRAVELSGGSPLYQAALGYCYALSGRREDAERILDELRRDPQAAPFDIALVYLGLGEHTSAILWLEKSYEARDSHLIYINRGPQFDPLRENPRFIRLMERIDWLPGDDSLQIDT